MSIAARRDVALKDLARLIDEEQLLFGAIDLDAIAEQIVSLRDAFPASTLHTVAAKAVPLRALLAVYAEAGMGCEAASRGELELAIAAGFPAERIVFDSPAKTLSDIRRAFGLGVSINVDNFGELERLAGVVAENDAVASGDRFLGIRINPQTGGGTIDAMSTATMSSKFGVGLKDVGVEEALLDAYAQNPWLNQLHVHSGSQGLTLEHAAVGIRAVVELAERINERVGHRQVRRIDIGGGLPVNFASDDITPTFAEYAEVLNTAVPGLSDYELLTEFGRALAAKPGFIVSRVEEVKSVGGQLIAVTHAGVQVATRTVFMPEAWPLRILAYDAAGQPKDTPVLSQDIAGPACFAGDLLARGCELPELERGDLVVVPDTGAYYFSTHFSYNMLPRIGVYGYRTNAHGDLDWWILREPQSIEEIVAEAGPAGAQRVELPA